MYWLFLLYEINVFLKENSLIFVLIFIGENFLDLDFFGCLLMLFLELGLKLEIFFILMLLLV